MAVLLLVAGCGGGPVSVAPDGRQPEALVQQADSLVDIAPDSTLVLCHAFTRDYTEAPDSLVTAVRIIEGNAYFSIGDIDEAKASMIKARELASRTGNTGQLINATADLGVFMRVSQQPDSALALYNKALAMIEKGNFPDEKAHLLTSVAVLYANRGMLDEAADYADKAVAAARDCGDADMIMYATSQAGAIYNLRGDSRKAFALSRQSIDDARRMGLPRYELKAVAYMIDLHLKDGRMDSVRYYIARGDRLAAQFPVTSVEGLGFMEEKYVVLAAMGHYRESLRIQQRLLSLQKSAPAYMPADKLWLRMARNYDALHMADSAAICYERAFAIADSIHGEDTDRRLSEFYARFKTTEKELAIASLEQEKARSDMWTAIWIGVAAALALLIVAGLLYMRFRRRKEEIKHLQIHLEGIEQERARLAKDLHDGICNDLYGIEMLLQTGTGREEILTDVERIRTETRRISHELMPPALQDVGLAEALRDMTDRLAHTYPDINFSYSCTPAVGWEELPVRVSYELYRICQELLGNIVRHSAPAEVSLALRQDRTQVELVLRHNGKPVSGEDSVRGGAGGIGVKSVEQRLAAIGATAEGLPYAPAIRISFSVPSA